MTRIPSRLLALALLGPVAAGCAGSPPRTVTPADPMASAEGAASAITAESARRHVAFLASDELAGRDTPSPGLEAAADYIARRFESAGLAPGGDGGAWLQRWTYEQVRLDREGAALRLEGPRGGAALAIGEQWFAFPSDQEVVGGRPLFLGPAEDLVTDFPAEASGRIVVAATGPQLGMELFGLVRAAADAGALGMVLLLDPAIPPEAIPTVAAQVERFPQPIPVAGVQASAAAELLAAAGVDPEALASAGAPAEIPGELQLHVPALRTTSTPPNVVGVLRGSDPGLRDEYVLFSAHFDHVGVGTPDAEGDSIYNGADDDASGTAVLIEVARAFGRLPEAPARSLVFLAVSGEEKGLLGSRWWAEHPTVPIERVVANLNFDMVGRNHPDTVIAIGAEYTTLGPLVRRVGAERRDVGLVAAPDPDPAEQAFFRSDHVSFMRHGVPALFLTTWLHEDYHRPSDEVETIDAEKLARVARLAFWTGWETAREPAPPRWNEGAWEEVRGILDASPF